MTTDLELLDAWREGRRDAGSELFERHFASLLRFFSNKGCHDVEDLVQRTFLSCVEARAKLNVRTSFRAYLFAVARNELYDQLKRDLRRHDSLNSSVRSLADLGISVSGAVAAREGERFLLDRMRDIPLDDQVALELYYWEDLSASELGAVLDLPEPAIRSRLRRAKDRLRTALRPEDQPEGPDVALLELEQSVRALGSALFERPR